MTHHELEKAMEAVRPGARDIALAAEAIRAAAGSRALPTDNFFQAVENRLASEPIPDIARLIDGVQEADVRRVRAATTTVTAVALLEARGALLPLSGAYPDRTWHLPWQVGGSASAYNVDVGYNYRLAAAYRAAPHGTPAPSIESPAIFLDHLPPAMGSKVRRLLLEAVDAYRAGLFLAAAVLIGIASEAAWGQVARAALATTNDPELRGLIENPLASAGAVQQQTDVLVRDLVRQRKLRGLELNALDALEQIYRDLRNYAAHRPDESFDEARVDRSRVGTLLDGSIDYFRRLYEIHSALQEVHP